MSTHKKGLAVIIVFAFGICNASEKTISLFNNIFIIIFNDGSTC